MARTGSKKRSTDVTRVGRRPLLLNDRMREDLLSAIRTGVPVTHAATRVGVSVSTLMAWCARGRAAQERAENARPPEHDDDLYSEFLDAIERARADASAALVATVQKAARGGYVRSEKTYTDEQGRLVHEKTYADVEWRAAQFLLERGWRAEFGKSTYVDVNVLTPNAALGLPEGVSTGGGGSGEPAGLDMQTIESIAAKVEEARRLAEMEAALDSGDVVDADVVED